MAGVETCHKIYEALIPQWQRCRDCTSGSDAVKARRSEYLPLLDSHKNDYSKYDAYITRALFYNATGRTVAGLSGAIFQKAPSIDPKNATAKEQLKDVTLTGEPIEQFALKVTKEYLITGRYGIFVDMASKEAVEPRPYWVGYAAEDIINWRFNTQGGDQELVLVVLREFVETNEQDDEFDIKPIKRYRVLRLKDGIYTSQLYIAVKQQDGSNAYKYLPEEETIPLRRGAPLNFIPFALPWAVNAPPLLDLADVNLSHYRASADLKHGLHMTALPTPWVSGEKGDGSRPLSIGSGKAWSLEKDGKAGMLEFTGRGLGAIRTDMQDMQRMMASLGARLLEEAPHYAETALSVAMRHSSDYATLRMLAQIVEQQLSFALKIHVWWLGSEPLVEKLGSNIELNKIFFDQSISADELRAMLLALQAGALSYVTFYQRLQNTSWMREGITADEEKADIKKDGDQFKKLPVVPDNQGDPGKAN